MFSRGRARAELGRLSGLWPYIGKTLGSSHISKAVPIGSLTTQNNFAEDKKNSVKAIKSLYDKLANNVKPEVVRGFNLALTSLTEQAVSLPAFQSVRGRLKEILVYNTWPATQFCGLLFLGANQFFEDRKSDAKNTCSQAIYALAWSCDWIMAVYYIMDDIVDGSHVRFNKPSWHTAQENEKANAIHEGLLLERAALDLVANTFSNHENTTHVKLASFFQNINSIARSSVILENVLNTKFRKGKLCSMEDYCWMRMQQNGYAPLNLQITAAAIVNGVVDYTSLKQLEDICLDISLYYAVAKDMLEICEGLTSMGDQMTDIKNGRITWPLLTAVAEASDAQRQVLIENIGKANEANVQRVLNIYEDLNVLGLHARWQTEYYERTCENIDKLSPKLPRQFLHNILDAYRTTLIPNNL